MTHVLAYHESKILTFAEFMRRSLYDPENGYYRRRDRNPFGASGDFYTAVHLSPVFGEVLSTYLETLQPVDVVDLGAGCAGLRQAMGKWNYRAVDWNLDPMPQQIEGVIIANEFFDALPVHVLQETGGSWHELFVDSDRGFVAPSEVDGRLAEYAHRYGSVLPEGGLLEVSLEMDDWMSRLGEVLTSGHLIVIDYGYDARELLRFPRGTLMSYSRHIASEDVLSSPGVRDITAHVNFTEMKRVAGEAGFQIAKECSLANWALDVFGAERLKEAFRRNGDRWRLRWKQLVFGMGETFRVLEFEKTAKKKKASDVSEALR